MLYSTGIFWGSNKKEPKTLVNTGVSASFIVFYHRAKSVIFWPVDVPWKPFGLTPTWVRIPHSPPEKPTSFDLSVFQLSAPFGAWSLLRKWSCPADSEVSAEVSGALNFILCASIILHYAVRHNFTSALADTSLKTARVRIHTQKRQKYLFCSP